MVPYAASWHAVEDEPRNTRRTHRRALEGGMAHRLDANSEVVLVVRSGEHMQAIGDALERLRLTGRSPAWIAVLDRDDLYD